MGRGHGAGEPWTEPGPWTGRGGGAAGHARCRGEGAAGGIAAARGEMGLERAAGGPASSWDRSGHGSLARSSAGSQLRDGMACGGLGCAWFFSPRREVSPKNPFLEAGWHCPSIMVGSLAPCRNRTLCSEGIHLSRGNPASQLDAGLGPFRLRQGRISSLS